MDPGFGAGVAALRNPVFDYADFIDLAAHDIASLQEARWVHAHADTLRRSGREQIAGLKGEGRRKIGDLIPDIVDHLRSVGILAQLAIDQAPQG